MKILVSVILGALVFVWFVAYHFYDKRRKEDDFWKKDDFRG